MKFNLKISEKNILNIITEIYIICIIILFPLIVDKTGFFKILECKYQFYTTISIGYILAIITTSIILLICKKTEVLKQIKITKIQIAVLVFWIVNIISCFVSPYFDKYNLFIGIGRGEGLINISLYCLTFLFITLFGKFKKRHLMYFVISGILITFIAVLQYIGFNPFNMYQDGIGTHNVSFFSTIGNLDFVSAILVIFLSIAFATYVFLEDKKYNNIFCLIAVLLGSFIIGIMDVDSGKVAFIGVLVLLLPLILLSSKRLYKTLNMLIMVLLGYGINLFMNPKYLYSTGELGFYFQFNYIILLYIIVIAILVILVNILKKEKYSYDYLEDKKLIKIIYLTIFALVVLAVLVVYIVDLPISILHEVHELLHGNFDDEFGTYRIFLWKRAITLVKDYPILGTGPDTFAARFMPKYYQDVADLGELTINDTAANVYLTMLVNIGILGLLSYLTFIALLLVKAIRKKDKYTFVLMISMVCYLIQDFFNLWVVIVTPVFWVLLAILLLSIKNQKMLKNVNE